MNLPPAYYPLRQLLEEAALRFPEIGCMVDHLSILAGARLPGNPTASEAHLVLRGVFIVNEVDPSIADRLPCHEFFPVS